MEVDYICGEPCIRGKCDAKADCANRGYCWRRATFSPPPRTGKLYVIGSLRNPEVPIIANRLREQLTGWEVFDDWYAAGERADDHWKEYEQGRSRGYLEALKGHAAQNVFAFDKKHLDSADYVLLVLPAGKSGHLELGYCAGRGKRTAILLEETDVRWDVMYQFAGLVTTDLEAVANDARWSVRDLREVGR